jgi:general secretion pathway protein B
MSYILEALRKAEAERERGAVPDLHTQPLVMSDRDEAPERPRWLLPAGLLVVATLLLAVFAWWLVQGKDERPQVVTRVAPPAPPATAPVPITPPASPPAAATEASPTAQSVAPRSEPVAPRSEPVTPRNEPALPPRVAAPSPSAPTAAQRAEKR